MVGEVRLVMTLLCHLFRHPYGQWRPYTWTRSSETLTFAVRSCWCGRKGEAFPVSAEPVLRMTEAGAVESYEGRIARWVH